MSDLEKQFKVYVKTLSNVISNNDLAAHYIEELETQNKILLKFAREAIKVTEKIVGDDHGYGDPDNAEYFQDSSIYIQVEKLLGKQND